MRRFQREMPPLDHGELSFPRQALKGAFRSQGLAFTRERPGSDQRDGSVRSRVTPPATSIVSGHAPLDIRGISNIQCAIRAAGDIHVVRLWHVSLLHTSPPEPDRKRTSSTETGAFQRSSDGIIVCPDPRKPLSCWMSRPLEEASILKHHDIVETLFGARQPIVSQWATRTIDASGPRGSHARASLSTP